MLPVVAVVIDGQTIVVGARNSPFKFVWRFWLGRAAEWEPITEFKIGVTRGGNYSVFYLKYVVALVHLKYLQVLTTSMIWGAICAFGELSGASSSAHESFLVTFKSRI
jgi:hypothetical protein